MSNPHPFAFFPRKITRDTPPALDQIDPQRCDLACEVVWTAITPIASTPVGERRNGEQAHNAQQVGNDLQAARWLEVPDANGNLRHALSPFAVKGAIQALYADLMGGCLRTERLGDKTKDWRWTRVVADTKPAVVSQVATNEMGEVTALTLTPIREAYCVHSAPHRFGAIPPNQCLSTQQLNRLGLQPGDPVEVAVIRPQDDCPAKFRHLTIVGPPQKNPKGAWIYAGPYTWGRDNLANGDHPDPHPDDGEGQHTPKPYTARVYQPMEDSLTVRSEAIEIWNRTFAKRQQELTTNNQRVAVGDNPQLKEGDIIYYWEERSSVLAFGRHFRFRWPFVPADLINPEQKACTNPQHLCPRCTLFGMVGTGGGDAAGGGYAGRFRSSSLVADADAEPQWLLLPMMASPPGFATQTSEHHKGHRLMGPYYTDGPRGRPADARVAGSKGYRHRPDLTLASLGQQCSEQTPADTQRFRTWAPVLPEGTRFTGVLGGQSLSTEEAAALIHLLHQPHGDLAFKLGLGKPLGLGSLHSCIAKVWWRPSGHSDWQTMEIDDVGQYSPEAVLEQLQLSAAPPKPISGLGRGLQRKATHLKPKEARGLGTDDSHHLPGWQAAATVPVFHPKLVKEQQIAAPDLVTLLAMVLPETDHPVGEGLSKEQHNNLKHRRKEIPTLRNFLEGLDTEIQEGSEDLAWCHARQHAVYLLLDIVKVRAPGPRWDYLTRLAEMHEDAVDEDMALELLTASPMPSPEQDQWLNRVSDLPALAQALCACYSSQPQHYEPSPSPYEVGRSFLGNARTAKEWSPYPPPGPNYWKNRDVRW